MASPLSLEGDGLIDNLFHFLWSKDDFNVGPRIFVPHTVVYKGAQPSAWYFTSLKTGKIKKKNKVNLTNLQIEHEFTKHSKQLSGRSSTDIVACYLYQVPAEGSADDSSEPSTTTLIEYFDPPALHDFLFAREKVHNGILQRFVLPKGTHNATIRAIWSPKICLLERRVNTKSLYDPRFSVYERGVTFDGGGAGELFSRPEPVRGAMLPGEVQLLCEQVVDHVTQVSYHKYRISRMVLHLKSDAEDRLWLLWCSSLRLLRVSTDDAAAPVRPLDIVSDAQVPAHISLGLVSHLSSAAVTSPSQQRQLRGSASQPQLKNRRSCPERDLDVPLREGFQRCTSCACVVEQHRMLTTNYKAVLEHFHRFLLFLRLKVNEKEQTAIEWPPDQRLIDTAGGVGFGILAFCAKTLGATSSIGTGRAAAKRSHLAGGLNAKELIIPPVIQYLHPTLGVDDFDRHRLDPIFLHKPVAVCENCCLVYSDYTTTALEVNSLRPNVPAILRPQREVNELKRRLDPIDAVSVVVTSPVKAQLQKGGLSDAKPPASAWKPIQKVSSQKEPSPASGTTGPTRPTLHALSPAPRLPDRIESLAEFIGIAGGGDGSVELPSSVQRQQEDSFFRELYHHQGVQAGVEGHPLHHMLESSEKPTQLSCLTKKQLAAILKGISALDGDNRSAGPSDWRGLGKSASMSALDHALGKKPIRNPYTVVQTLDQKAVVRNKTKLGHKTKQRDRGKQLAGSGSHSEYVWLNDVNEEDERNEGPSPSASKSKRASNNKSPPRRFISSREALASEAHQDFLFAALQDAQTQLDHLGALSCLVLPPTPSVDDASAEAATVDELRSVMSESAFLHDDRNTDDKEDGT